MPLQLPAAPDRTSLCAAFGFPVPEAFVQLCAVLYADSVDHVQAQCEAVTHYYLTNGEMRYQQTPPELFPFFDTGVDGEHYGYVIHVPQEGAVDYPVGRLCPMDDDGVLLAGESTREALENIIAFDLKIDEIPLSKASREVRAFCSTYGLAPTRKMADRCYDDDGNGRPVMPTIPAGWRYLPSTDGIGVLAPEAAFDPKADAYTAWEPINDVLAKSDAALQAGYPATALYFLRETYWHEWTTLEVALQLSARLIDAYQALNRPLLAREVERRIALLQRTAR